MNKTLKISVVALSLAFHCFGLFASDFPSFDETRNGMIAYESNEKFDPPYRLLANKDPKGHSIELDDGSVWRITSDNSIVQLWRENDSLVIYPIYYQFWYGSPYYILNERTQETVNVELSYGPILNQPTNAQLVYIDYKNGKVQIQDGAARSSWFKVDPSELEKLKGWKLNQSIILGANEGSWNGYWSAFPYILINVEKDEFITAEWKR